MPQKSRWTVPVPPVSLPTFMFGSPTAPLGSGLAYADADRPDLLSMTWTAFRLWCQRLAAGLLAAGLEPGDRVVIFSPNNVLYPVLFTGVIMAGGIFSPANAHFVARELTYQLRISGASFLLASPANLAAALDAADAAGMDRRRVFLFDHAPLEKAAGAGHEAGSEGVKHWSHLLASEEAGARFFWEELTADMSKTRSAALIFSSGTTGLPKGVEVTHYNLVANAAQTSHVMNLDPQQRTPELSARNSTWLCAIPMYHGLGLCYYTTISVPRRVTTYIMRQFDLDAMLRHIQTYRITELQLVPPIIVAMSKHAGIKSGRFDISSVTKTFSCAAPLGPDATLRYESLWPDGLMNVKQGLAMSESGCNTIGWDPCSSATAGSVGEPMPNCEIKLVDDNETEVVPGQRGEVWVRCPNTMKGYWDNQQATADTITPDGWLKTGDIALQDKNGFYHIVDRKKELIKVKGVQVAPAELEAILLDHPGVSDAAVIGVKSGEDEVPRAYVVRNPTVPVCERDIVDFMDGKVSSIKRLTGGVIFTDTIPRTPAGKILRRLIQEKVARDAKL